LEDHVGTVKFFNGERGFGFITPDGGGADVFVHISAVQRSGLEALEPDQRLAFQTLPDRFGKGPKAINLSLIDGGGAPAKSAPSSGTISPDYGADDQPDMGGYDPE
jgi:CspA family cold shock protein